MQENPSHLPPKRWDGENFRPTYPGGTDFWLPTVTKLASEVGSCLMDRDSETTPVHRGSLRLPVPVNNNDAQPGDCHVRLPASVGQPLAVLASCQWWHSSWFKVQLHWQVQVAT